MLSCVCVCDIHILKLKIEQRIMTTKTHMDTFKSEFVCVGRAEVAEGSAHNRLSEFFVNP